MKHPIIIEGSSFDWEIGQLFTDLPYCTQYVPDKRGENLKKK